MYVYVMQIQKKYKLISILLLTAIKGKFYERQILWKTNSMKYKFYESGADMQPLGPFIRYVLNMIDQ